jgi:hypothetical protein
MISFSGIDVIAAETGIQNKSAGFPNKYGAGLVKPGMRV